MINISIFHSSDKIAEIIKSIIIKNFSQTAVIHSCTSYDEFIKHLNLFPSQIFILDSFKSNSFNNLLAEEIRMLYPHSIIIYVSENPDFAVKSYDYSAFYYFIFPFIESKFINVLNHAIKTAEDKNCDKLCIKTKSGHEFIQKNEIIYIEYYNRCIKYYLINGQTVTSLSFRESFSKFASEMCSRIGFIHPHSSYIVNADYIKSISHKNCILKNDMILPVSRNKSHYIKLILNNTSSN